MTEDPKSRTSISRRKFLHRGVQGTAGLTLAQGLPAVLVGSLSCTVAQEVAARTVRGACHHDCPDTCSWTVTAEGGTITEFRASRSNPFTAGRLCSKMERFPEDVTFHPDRLLTPLKRTGPKGEGIFEPVGWDEAIADVAGRLGAILSEHGGEAVLPYSFAGTEGKVQMNSISARFFASLGASRLERTICGDAAVEGVLSVWGQTTGALPEDVVHSRYLLFWGTNPVLTNQHLWPLVEEARARGAKVVVVDPFRSATAEAADWHVQPLPGTDVSLALSVIQVLIDEGLHDAESLARHAIGFEKLAEHVQAYAPEQVAEHTGVAASDIRRLAREYAAGEPSLLRILIGMEHQASGAQAFRAVSMLPAITGSWKVRGGGFLHMTWELFGRALDWTPLELAGQMEDDSTRKINMVQIGRALLEPEDPIRALFVYNSNPAVIAPDQNRVMEGLAREDLFTVVLDHFVTDTARYADYVFPATTQLEHWDLMTSWGQEYLNLNEPAIAPRGESKPNSEFFRLLARAMGRTEEALFEPDLDIVRAMLVSDHELLEGITFDSLRETGWARLNVPADRLPFGDGQFETPSGKIELFSERLEENGHPPLPVEARIERSEDEKKRYPLRVLTPKSTRNFLNSSKANVGRLRQKEGSPRVDLHTEDAASRGIADGDRVEVFNERGRVILEARISARVRPGVVSLPQGHWPSLMEGGRSANALTSDRLTDMGGGAAVQENWGDVRALRDV